MDKSKKEKSIRKDTLEWPEYSDIDPDDCEFFDQGYLDDIDEEFDAVFPAAASGHLLARRAVEARLEERALRLSLEDFPD